jgi:hypothetical protein
MSVIVPALVIGYGLAFLPLLCGASHETPFEALVSALFGGVVWSVVALVPVGLFQWWRSRRKKDNRR